MNKKIICEDFGIDLFDEDNRLEVYIVDDDRYSTYRDSGYSVFYGEEVIDWSLEKDEAIELAKNLLHELKMEEEEHLT